MKYTGIVDKQSGQLAMVRELHVCCHVKLSSKNVFKNKRKNAQINCLARIIQRKGIVDEQIENEIHTYFIISTAIFLFRV